MTSSNSQSMKPATVAKKLGIYLPATPQEFQDSSISREEFNELQSNPPEWLAELRRNGPHPRPVVAQKLNISISGLARGGVEEALTTAEITELLQTPRSGWSPNAPPTLLSVPRPSASRTRPTKRPRRRKPGRTPQQNAMLPREPSATAHKA